MALVSTISRGHQPPGHPPSGGRQGRWLKGITPERIPPGIHTSIMPAKPGLSMVTTSIAAILQTWIVDAMAAYTKGNVSPPSSGKTTRLTPPLVVGSTSLPIVERIEDMATSSIARRFPHHWIVEAVTQTKPSPFRDGDIDGELYTARFTRGNLKGRCRDCRTTKTFHPFTHPEGHEDVNMQAMLTGSRGPMLDPMLAVKPRPNGSYDAMPTLF